MDNSNFASCSKLRFVLFRCFSRIILSHASNNNPIPKNKNAPEPKSWKTGLSILTVFFCSRFFIF